MALKYYLNCFILLLAFSVTTYAQYYSNGIPIDGGYSQPVLQDNASSRQQQYPPRTVFPAPEKKSENVSAPLGYPTAPSVLNKLKVDMTSQINSSVDVRTSYLKWLSYLDSQLKKMELTDKPGGYNGLAQLPWYKKTLLNPLDSPEEIEKFSRFVHAGFVFGYPKGYDLALRTICEKLNIPFNNTNNLYVTESFYKSFDALNLKMNQLHGLHAQALADLTPEEIQNLNVNMYHILTRDTNVGHSVSNQKLANSMIKSLKKIDQKYFYRAASILLSVADADFLFDLSKLKQETVQAKMASVLQSREQIANSQIKAAIGGEIIGIMESPNGLIILGGRGNNAYDLNALSNVCAIIDIGGNDTYKDGAVCMNRPLLIIIDMEGNDRYIGSAPAIQGAAILGFSLLIDMNGDDVYQAGNLAQGSALGGVGLLIDKNGNDQYWGDRRVQGTALAGLGILIDEKGRDSYHAAMWAQGLGHPLGVGIIDDFSGDDEYYCGGKYLDSYPDTPGYEGWGQGVGAGLRDIANGGIGIFLEGGGSDSYEYDYIAHGGGYWQGVGILRDFSGNDNHSGATKLNYDKKPRSESRFQRFGNGFGCHYAAGFLIDDFGDDVYDSTIMNTGFGWDAAYGYCIDFSGNDRYLATGGNSAAQGEQSGMGILFDFNGNDRYASPTMGFANPVIKPNYHDKEKCGGNFAFFYDLGGADVYNPSNPQLRNNFQTRMGSNSGFFIDRSDNNNAPHSF